MTRSRGEFGQHFAGIPYQGTFDLDCQKRHVSLLGCGRVTSWFYYWSVSRWGSTPSLWGDDVDVKRIGLAYLAVSGVNR